MQKIFKIALVLIAEHLIALPTSPIVVSGDANFNVHSPEVIEITVSDRAILDWESFSLEAGETVRFSQPHPQACALNRVIGPAQSELLGRLESNGQLILINPNGVLIGREARFDVGSWIASTLDLQNELFVKKGRISFAGDSLAKICHLGEIRAKQGDICFIGKDIDQQGLLETKYGAIALVGSDYQSLFNAKFADETPSFLTQSGTVRSLRGEKGGTIHLMADALFLFGSSQIDTSNRAGEGEIFIGAGMQGKDAAFTNARQIYVEKGATFFADALEIGNGGRVILFSNGTTAFEGMISARGGFQGGDGGFAEVSGKELSYLGFSNLTAPAGNTGTLLLDPFNIIIGTVAAGVNTILNPPNFPFCNTTVCPPNCTTAPACAACPANPDCSGTVTTPPIISQNQPTQNITLPVGILAAQIGGSHVILDSTSPGAAAGNITWSAGALNDFIYNSPNDLVLRAPATGTVTILANVQNLGAGRTIIDTAGPAVNIGRPVGATTASFGSSNGLTRICAPNAVVTVRGGTVTPASSRIGFISSPANPVSTGPIYVSCDSLSLLAGTAALTGALIGHGAEINIGFFNSSTTATATITVHANQDIRLETPLAAAAQANAWIGHGNHRFDLGSPVSNDQAGNIEVISQNGNIFLQHLSGTDVNCTIRIGHGGNFFTGVAGTVPAIAGDISVRAPAGQIFLRSNSTQGNQALIGHGGFLGFQGSIITTDIYVACRDNLTLDGGVLANQNVSIGSASTSLIPIINQNIQATVGGNLTLISTQRTILGSQVFAGAVYTGEIKAVVGGTIDMFASGGTSLIGVSGGTTLNGNVFVAAGGDILMEADSGQAVTIEGGADVRVAALGNIITSATAGHTSIGTARKSGVAMPTTCIHAGENIIASNGVGSAFLGYEGIDLVPGPYNVDIRAGGDIQLAQGFTGTSSPVTGFVFIEADSQIPLGDLWDYTGTEITSVCGAAFNPAFPICETNLFAAPLNAPSPAIAANNSGAIRVATTANITVTTTTGDITFHSAGSQVGGALQDMTIGAAPNLLNIVTASGDIDISGSICPDGFNNLTINAIANPWTSGIIYLRASNDLAINDDVVTSGAASPITLISDCDQTGSGNVILNDNVTTLNGAMTINAGILDSQCDSIFCSRSLFSGASILQTAGTVRTTGGAILLLAQNNIQLDPVPTPGFSLVSATGPIQCFAGNDFFLGIGQNIQTAGAINLVAGRDLTLEANASITSTLSSVTIVVDNNFPTCPFTAMRSEIGIFSMQPGSSITGTPLLIFTAQQQLNSVAGLLNGSNFSPSPQLFSDSATEVWCTFFSCPSSFSSCSGTPFAPGLGSPFTLFYKDCLALVVNQANLVSSQFLYDAGAINYFLEWPAEFSRFSFAYHSFSLPPEYYWIQRTRHRIVHMPTKKLFFGLSDEVISILERENSRE